MQQTKSILIGLGQNTNPTTFLSFYDLVKRLEDNQCKSVDQIEDNLLGID